MSAAISLYRSLSRHKLFAALNIGGLALGIAVFLMLYLFVRFETGYDRVLPGWERVWKVERTMQFTGAPQVNIPSRREMLALLRGDYPETVGTRMLVSDTAVQMGQTSAPEQIARVDRNYFALFPATVIAGDIGTTLRRPDGVVVTERIARTYLGTGSPLGRTLSVTIDGKPRPFRVGALIRDLPVGLTYRNDIFAVLMPDTNLFGSGSKGLVTFLRFGDAAAAARRGAQLAAFDRRHPDPNFTGPSDKLRVTQTLQPLHSLHLAQARDRTVVAVLGTVGLLALLVAIGNYVNLATARGGLRAREVAVRKVVGATRRALIAQFIAESIVTVTLATLLGLALAELALPLVNAISGMALSIRYVGAGTILPAVAVMILAVALLSGFYPAFMLSRYQPAGVLASAKAPGGGRGGRHLRQTLAVIQFAVAITLMIGTAVLTAQTRHLQAADLGFRRDGLIMMPSFANAALDTAQRAELAATFTRLSGIQAVTQSSVAAGGGSMSIGTMHRDGATGQDPNIIGGDVGPGFFQVYGARLLAGRLFDPARFAGDEAAADALAPGGNRQYNLVLNRTAVARLGLGDPAAVVGKSVLYGDDRATIVGVIDDIRFGSPREPVEAVAYKLRSRNLFAPILALRHDGNDSAALLTGMEGTWRRIAPTVPFQAATVDQTLYDQFYRQDVQRSRLFTIGAVLATLIGCIGLYGLAAFDTERRVREIGIRKVLGASTGDVLRLLLGQFLRPVLLANLIAWPIAWVAMSRWLSGFDDRIALSPLYFLAASALALVIAAATVAGQAWRVARAEPARALRQL